MPWPGCFPCHGRNPRAASSASLAPLRSGVRRSDSVRANKQFLIWPSAVSRTRSHAPQNGFETAAMMPTE